MLIGLLDVALAGPVVVPGPDLDHTERRVRIDLLARDITLRPARDLPRDSAPYLVRTPPWTRCTGPRTSTDLVLQRISEAEELRLAMRAEASLERLHRGEQAWICLGESTDATLGARLYFLLGIAHHARGDAPAATDAFRAALRSDPDLPWDERFAPDARATFDAARAEPRPASVRLTLVPPDAPITLHLDGRVIAPRDGGFDVPSGPHLMQVDGVTRWADLQADDWLVIPRWVDDELVAGVETSIGRTQLAGLLEGIDEPVLIADQRSTWEYASGTWSEHRAPVARRLARPLTVAGLVIAAGGAGWWVAEEVARNQRIASIDEGLSTPDYDAIVARDEAAQRRRGLAAGTVGVGLVTAGFGVTWMVTQW